MGGLRPPYPPTGFPARFAGGNGGDQFDLFGDSLGRGGLIDCNYYVFLLFFLKELILNQALRDN